MRQSSESHDHMSDMNQEFVSEDYDASAVNIEEIRREIEQLSTSKKIPGKHCSIIFSYCIKFAFRRGR